jgi:hypothetical protein
MFIKSKDLYDVQNSFIWIIIISNNLVIFISLKMIQKIETCFEFPNLVSIYFYLVYVLI